MKKKLLIVVDMQNDFVDGALGTSEAKAIVPKVIDKIKSWDGDIWFTKDTHYDDYLKTREGCNLVIPHCIKGTVGHNINEQVLNAVHDMQKETPNKFIGFFEKNFFCDERMYELIAQLKNMYDRIEFIGLCTDICVLSNAITAKAVFPETYIVVDATCCAGSTPEMHKKAIDILRVCQVGVI